MKWLMAFFGCVPASDMQKVEDEANKYAFALLDIISMQTPYSNATVRRMVRRAEEALK